MVDGIKDYAIILLDPQGRIVTWNEGARRLKGYTEAEIVGHSVECFYPEEARAAGRPAELLRQAAAEGRVEDEGWRVRKDGSRFFADVILTPIRDAVGELIGFAKITRNISERRQAEEALRLSEERFRLLVSSVKDYAIILLDPNGRILTWNEGAQRLKGYTEAEIIGRSMQCFYPPEDLAAGKPAHLLSLAEADGRVEDEGWRVRKDGTRFFADVILTALHGADGQLAGFAKVTRDITQRKQIEDVLAASEARYRLLADNVTDVIMRVGADGRRTYISPSIRDLTGYEPEELIDGPHGQLVHPDDRAAWGVSFGAASDTGVSGATYRVIRKDGSHVWVEATRRRLPDGGLIACLRNITVRKRVEEELREAKRQAEQAHQARITFFTELSHELRSPLNAIIGFAGMMQRQMLGPVGNPAYLENATDIEASGQHLLNLINDILDHAKAEEGYLELVEETVDISEVVDFVAHMVAPRATAGGVVMSTTIAPDVGKVRGDSRRLKQILLNLATNAVKFTPSEGRVVISAALDLGGALLVSVEDNGSGIAEEDQARIFQPFRQAKRARLGSTEGTGLGLPLTKRLVELHGGIIEVDSALGRGTTMTVRLPAARIIAAPPSPSS